MARQQVVVVALVLLATVGLAFAADPPSTPKPGLLTFSGVPSAGPVAADNNEVGTVGGDSGSSDAASPGGADVSAGPVGAPVSASTFGGGAEGPTASAAEQLSAGAAVAAAAASFFFF